MAALRAARARAFDLMLASAYRRDADGGDPLAELRRAFPTLPLLVLEKLEEDGDGRGVGGTRAFHSFSVERLIAAVRRSLDGQALA